jgi:hypothetical protein
MRATVGDWLVVKTTRIDQADKRGQITDIRSDDGSRPYIVRWLDTDTETMVFPGSDAVVVTAEEQHATEARAQHRFDVVQSAIRHDRRR